VADTLVETFEWVDPDGVVIDLDVLASGLSGRFLPPIAFSEESVPLQAGSRLRQVRPLARDVALPFIVVSSDPVAKRMALRRLAAAMDPTRGDGRLRCGFAGQMRELRCRYAGGFDLDESADLSTPEVQRALVVFRAFDPFWYDQAVTAVTVGPTQASFFPILPLRLSGSEVYADTEVDNDGDVETWPLWTVTGPGVGPVLRNLTTGKAIDLTGVSLGAGETVEIDTRPGFKTVRRGDGSNLYGEMVTPPSSLWPLVKGSNSLRLEMSATTADTSFALRYQRRWLSA
jgi:hypothetical protein